MLVTFAAPGKSYSPKECAQQTGRNRLCPCRLCASKTAEYHLAHQLAKQAGRNRLSRILRSKTVLLTKPWRLARTNRRASRAKPHQSSTPCSPERLQSPKAVVIDTAAVSMKTAATMAAAAGFQPCFLSCAGCNMDDSATMAMAKAQDRKSVV